MPVTAATYFGKSTDKKHIEQALREILQSEEILLGAFHGQSLSGDGYGIRARYKGGMSLHDYLLVTDRRVVKWARGLLRQSSESFDYDQIAGVEETSGLLLGEIVLNIRGAKERMRSMVKTDVPIAAKMIREQMTRGRSAVVALVPPPLPPVSAFVFIAGEVKGPYSRKQLAALLETGIVLPDTQACYQGSEEWLPLERVLN